jgi:enediyne biosynthesis protein E4
MRRLSFIIVCLGLLAAGIWALTRRSSSTSTPGAEQPTEPPWFEDVTRAVGLDFVHDCGPLGNYPMPEQVGSGAALFDFDKDGRLDIYLLQNGGPQGAKNRLYKQLRDGSFKDVSAGSGLDFAGYNMGVAIGDVNNDGWPDVLVTQYDGVRLFLNNGDGTFADVTAESGLSNPSWGTSAAFFDYDRDDRLDLVVACYVDYDPTWVCKGGTGERDYCAPRTFRGRVSRLFHNMGPGASPSGGKPPRVRFEDVTEASGLGALPGPGLGVVCADFNGDGWPDIFIANDGAPNCLWINHHDGTFHEEAVQRGIAYNAMGQAQAGMGVALGDVDGDGLFDIYVTHLSEETNILWKQGPRGVFRDRTAAAGLITQAWRGTGFGTLLADFDHDGALDLAVVNGRVSARPTVQDTSLGPFWSRYGDRNLLFAGDGTGRFRDISLQNTPFCGYYNVGRGLVRGDIDGDGAQDLLVTSIGGPARIFRNVAPKRGHWLEVRAYNPALKRDALGAEVRIRAGERERVTWLHSAESYLCSSEPIAHFGLGAAERVDGIEVLWPEGERETFPGCAVDRRVELHKGSGHLTSK